MEREITFRRDSWVELLLHLKKIAMTENVNQSKLLKVTIIVNQDGTPAMWNKPSCDPISPTRGANDWLNNL